MSASPGNELYLGVDGTGKTTQAVIMDARGKILGRGLGPTCDPYKVGFEKMCEALATAVEGALGHVPGARAAEGRPWHRIPIGAACFGLAGIDSKADQDRAMAWVARERMAPVFKVVNDSEVILEAGTPEGWGVALIASTGSICLGRTKDGRTARVGGWGHVFGDEGSGFRIGVEAVRAASHAADGRGQAHGLLKAILGFWRLKTPEEMVAHIYKPTFLPHDFADLAHIVLDCATRGDAGAREVVDRAADDLAQHVQVVVRKLNLEGAPLAFGGSMFRTAFRKAVLERLTVTMGASTMVQDPAQGAAIAAHRMTRPAAQAALAR